MSANKHERGLTRTPHGGLKCIKARTRTEKKLYTLPGRYLAPLFLENATEIRYRIAFLSCSVCFLISQPRVSGPKTEHESFFLGRLANLRETKKSLPQRLFSACTGFYTFESTVWRARKGTLFFFSQIRQPHTRDQRPKKKSSRAQS